MGVGLNGGGSISKLAVVVRSSMWGSGEVAGGKVAGCEARGWGTRGVPGVPGLGARGTRGVPGVPGVPGVTGLGIW